MIAIRTAWRLLGQRLENVTGSLLHRMFRVREPERQLCVRTFFTLFFMVAAHTMLETIRDTLLVTHMPSCGLGLMYIALAGLTLFANAAAVAVARRLGHRRAVTWVLIVVACGATALELVGTNGRGALAVYLFSGVEGAVLLPQFWLLAARLFTLPQGRRLFGFIGAGGVAGGALGAGASALFVHSVPVKGLLPIASGCFLLAALTLSSVACDGIAPALLNRSSCACPRLNDANTSRNNPSSRNNPYLVRVVATGAFSTAAVLVVDYLFKSATVGRIPAAHIAGFFARFYIVMNLVSLGVQVVVTQPALRRLGAVRVAGILPWLLVGGGVATFLGGGSLAVVFGLKVAEAALCCSLNRVATELLYVPVPEKLRDRTRGVVESVVGRGVRACTGGILYLLALRTLATPRVLALLVVFLSLVSALLVLSLRRPYFNLVRSMQYARANDREDGASLTMVKSC
jgi:AAA family ATP:ADP antiporter